jgi:hypothetical protein
MVTRMMNRERMQAVESTEPAVSDRPGGPDKEKHEEVV